ncbi:MAG: hypothetical protein ACJ8AO_15335 [Gemmatimonadaceae bacterium]
MTFAPIPRRFALSLASALGAALVAACSGGEGKSANSDTSKPLDSLAAANRAVSAGGEVAARADSGVPAAGGPVTPASAAGGPTSAGDTTRAKVNAAAPDTARVHARVVAGRPSRDSLALVRTIKYGERKGWPVRMTPPAPGAILPHKRIIAFYGNPLSKKMGVLGEYPPEQMLAMLDKEVAAWAKADPKTPVLPALHMVVSVAQGAPGKDGGYRLRMDSSVIERAYGWAKQKNALFFVDIQTGQSTIQNELPWIERFLRRPDVHFAMDPEFNMHRSREGVKPGGKIGTYDAEDINFAIRYVSNIVRQNKLPPKVFVVHRFTRNMVTNADKIITNDPNVQVVMDMDGWGPPWLKFDSYRDYIVYEPVQYTGFKLFYHNDTKKGDKLLSPLEVLQLRPAPMYIQYQ